jgi:predicted DNA-binding ribbon-helix-helix protein
MTRQTTIRLETIFWKQIDVSARRLGVNWQKLVLDLEKQKPSKVGLTSWLRVNCLLMAKEYT